MARSFGEYGSPARNEQEGVTVKDLLILGTGIHAEEMAEIVDRVNHITPTWNLIGYLQHQTDGERRVGEQLNGVPIVGTHRDTDTFDGAFFVSDNGGFEQFGVPTGQLISLADPTSFISRSATIGPGCVFYPGCVVGAHATVGTAVFCLAHAVINHDCVVGDRTVMATAARLAGYCKVGDDCYLGQACTVREYTTIGRHTLVGTGAVVVRSLDRDQVVVGNPARFLKVNTRA